MFVATLARHWARLGSLALMLGSGFAAIGIGVAIRLESPGEGLMLMVSGLVVVAAAPLLSRFAPR